MVDADDVQGYGTKLQNQLDKLEDAEIDERDHEKISRWITHLRVHESINEGTVVGHLNRLRLSAERATAPLVEMDKAAVDEFMLTLEDEHGLSEGSRRNYRKSLRRFFNDHLDREWGEEITIGASLKRQVDPDDALSREEISEILKEAANPRDKALIAILADTGLRVGAVLSFQMRHVSIDGDQATLTINDEANVKGDDGPKPLTWSRGYVANWIDVHPRPDVPNAALIHKLHRWSDDEDGALRQQYAGRIVKRVATDAGFDADRVEARLFRSSAVTRWILEDMNEQAIKHRTGWSPDSRMFEVYSRVDDDKMNDLIFEHYGIETDSGSDSTPDLERCPSCRTSLHGHELFCPGCATALSQSAQEDMTDLRSSVFDRAISESDEEIVALLRDLNAALDSDPETRRIAADIISD